MVLSIRLRPFTRRRAHVDVCVPNPTKIVPPLDTLLLPYFLVENKTPCVLVKDLASLWNFPSSYQVIALLSRNSGVPRRDLVNTTNEDINQQLVKQNLILKSDEKTSLFFIELAVLVRILDNDTVLFGPYQLDEFPLALAKDPTEDKVFPTLLHVFPDYGEVEKSLPLNHATFLALNSLTKLQVSTHEGTYRRIYGSSLTPTERELLAKENNFSMYEHASEGSGSSSAQASPKSEMKKSGKTKRIANLDPNLLDVTENILPGCGLIPKFSVNSLCKVPNYYATTNLMSITQQNSYYNPSDRHLKNLNLGSLDAVSHAKLINLLIPSGDQDSFLYKYYYYKHYRGPGTGGYKDAALTGKMNKIKTVDTTSSFKRRPSHIPAYKVMKQEPVATRSIKGLIHPYYSKENVDVLVQRQRVYTEDFTNMEMLHTSNTYNILVNAYRHVANKTWETFYKFKMLDFEKLYAMQQQTRREKRKVELLAQQEQLQLKSAIQLPTPPELAALLKPDLSLRFTTPSQHPEIIEKLPVELRGDLNEPESQISKPIRYVTTIADKTTPEVLSQIEVVKLPNANAIAWDNLRKFRRP